MKTNYRNFVSEFGLVILFIIAVALVSWFVPFFWTSRNMIGLLASISTGGIIAGSMMLCLATRDFDLSIGSNVAFSGMIVVMASNWAQSVGAGIALALIGGTLVGFFNGIMIAKLKVNALITTLATMQIIRSFALISSDGRAVGVSNEFFNVLGQAKMTFLPTPLDQVTLPIWVMILSLAAFGFILNRTVFGRNALAIGGNPDAARLAGVNVDWTRIAIFTIQGLMCAIAGILLASRITSGQPNNAVGLELTVISACVLGGVSLAGGRATILGVTVGVLILGIAGNAMSLKNIPAFYQLLVNGVILLLAVLLDNVLNRSLRRR
jgi:L-arabinose transport system permease protein